MARLRDVPKAFKTVGTFTFFKRIWKEIADDAVFVWASALAYAWLFAIFPFMIFLLTLIPQLPDRYRDRAMTDVRQAVQTALAAPAAKMINDNIDSVLNTRRTGLLSVGLIVTLWAASGGMNMTMSALDKCYDVPRGRPLWIQRPLAILLTLVVTTLIIAVLVLVPIGTALTHYFERHPLPYITHGMVLAWNMARYSVAAILLVALLAVVYYWGPSIRQRFHILTPGAAFTLTVWILLGVAFRLYVNKFGKYDQTYGTVGGVAVLLLFFYIDAVVLLIGAEINSEIDFILGVPRGSLDFRRVAPKPGTPVPTTPALDL